ncbi:MAG: hypothetical protein O9301_02740 [Leptospira sp.]|nr:hypothetical protein [Leptospira sp.]
MKQLSFILIGLFAILNFTNCTTSYGTNGITGAKLGSFLDIRSLSRKDYKVIGSVKGETTFTRTRYLLPFSPFTSYNFGFVGLQEKRDMGSISGYPSFITPLSPLDFAKDQAIYNALDKLESADAILQPRFATKCTNVQYFIFSEEKCTVTVTGKAISVNEG